MDPGVFDCFQQAEPPYGFEWSLFPSPGETNVRTIWFTSISWPSYSEFHFHDDYTLDLVFGRGSRGHPSKFVTAGRTFPPHTRRLPNPLERKTPFFATDLRDICTADRLAVALRVFRHCRESANPLHHFHNSDRMMFSTTVHVTTGTAFSTSLSMKISDR